MSLGEVGINWNGVRMMARALETDLYLDVVCTGYMIFKLVIKLGTLLCDNYI